MQEGGQQTLQGDKFTPPLISIVTVCYNAGSLLETCIQSVVNQEYKGIEHILIDGASTDNTLDILQLHDRKLAYWRSEPDSGIYNAMNKALDFLRGKWVLFLGADDQLLGGFSEVIRFLQDQQTIYYTNVLYDDIPVGRKINGYFLAKNNLCQQSILYPRSVFEKYRFEEKYTLYADHYLNMQCWSDPTFRFEYCNLLTARFATDGASSHHQDLQFLRDKARIIKLHFGYWIYWRYQFKSWKFKFRTRKHKNKTGFLHGPGKK